MKKISREDLIPVAEYDKLADRFLKEVIHEKRIRRTKLNDRMTGLFETKLTIWYQIMEMIRAERIEDETYLEEMLDVYNELIPEDHEFSMTLFIEIPNQQELREFNKTIVGIENHVELAFGEHTIRSYEPGADEDDEDHYTQSVHYLRFPFTPDQKDAFLHEQGNVFIKVTHPNFQSEYPLNKELVLSLQKELQA
ncbi:DUF3501 family protein [Rubeoparvulum massiliense]|uniref:DUF3501 family protein n=1 Tax=Rubeoparvulum massiliense TaxID=1631346 RepID=UPI00065E3247|nr:DUF3501 family protein [Rubeoparvulum massiliense]